MCLQLLPLMWLGLLALTSLLLAALKWLLLFRIRAGTFQKYDWTSRAKAVNMAVQVTSWLPILPIKQVSVWEVPRTRPSKAPLVQSA